MKNALLKMGTFMQVKKEAALSKAKSFLKDETSAKGSSEEGYLVYAGIVVGIIVLGIIVVFMKGGFTSIGSFFQDGITGSNTNPSGWGK